MNTEQPIWYNELYVYSLLNTGGQFIAGSWPDTSTWTDEGTHAHTGNAYFGLVNIKCFPRLGTSLSSAHWTPRLYAQCNLISFAHTASYGPITVRDTLNVGSPIAA